MLSRRDFLTLSATTVWTIAISNILDSNFLLNSLSKLSENKKWVSWNWNYLDKNFLLSEDKDVFAYFVKLIEYIDDDINIVRWIKFDYKNNKIIIPFDFKYRDIPKLLEIIKNRSSNKFLENEIEKIKGFYLSWAKTLKNNSNWEQDIYSTTWLKLFTIYSIFCWVTDEKIILSNYLKLDEIWINNNIQNEINIINSRVNYFWVFKFEKDEIKTFQGIFNKNSEEGFAKLKVFLNEKFKWKNSAYIDFVLNKLKTKYRVDELFWDWKDSSVSQILQQCESLLNKNNKKLNESNIKKFEKLLNKKIEKSIQIELKRNFEKVIFELMIKDINIKNWYKEILEWVTRKIDKEKSINMYLNYFINSRYNKDERDKMFSWINWKNIKSKNEENQILISYLNQHERQLAEKNLNILNSMFDSWVVEKIQKWFKNWDYLILKNKLGNLWNDEKLLLLYIFAREIWFSLTWYLQWDTFRETSSNDRFEIKNLKRKNSKYSCMAISAWYHYILEYILWLKDLWVSFQKYQSEKMWHFSNWIQFWDKILIIDATYNNYYISDLNNLNEQDIYNIDNFANSYMSWAYYNVIIDICERNKNPLSNLLSFANRKKERKFLNNVLINYPKLSRIPKKVNNQLIIWT